MNNITIKNPCKEEWNQMKAANNGRYCYSCDKVVIDFTEYTDVQIRDYFKNIAPDQRICGRFYKSQLNHMVIKVPSAFLFSERLPFYQVFLLLLLLCFASIMFSCDNTKANVRQKVEIVIADSIHTVHLKKQINSPKPAIPGTSTDILGEVSDYTNKIDKMPEFKGGTKALVQFMKTNLRYPEDERKNKTEGRVLISFIIDSTGRLQKPEIVRGISKSIDNETLRLINSLPTWIPGKHKGKNIEVKIMLPVHFQP